MSAVDTTNWYDPIGDDTPTFEAFVGADVPTLVVRDPQLEARGRHARAQLRSLPLLQTFGFETVVHADVMGDEFKLVEYDHVPTNGIDDASALSFPLVHVATQEGIDDFGEQRVLRRLFERSIDEGGRYVLVTDTAAPKTPTFTKKPGKSIVDEFGATIIRDYEHLSSVFIERHLDSQIPVADTRNVFFHAASTIHHRQGAPAASIADLFDYTVAPSDSPVWESARFFIRHDLDSVLQDYAERLREALRSWTERGDTGQAANQILDVIQRCDYDLEQFEEYRTSPPERL
jgi:hypothetical protein